MSTLTDGLRIYRKLDIFGLSEAAIEYFTKHDGRPDLVDSEKVRDYVWTDEIVANTIEYVIGDAGGEILADGFQTMYDAEQARANAKVKISLVVEAPEEDEPTPITGRKSRG